MGLPPLGEGSAWVLVFSLVDWTPFRTLDLMQVEKRLKKAGVTLSLPLSRPSGLSGANADSNTASASMSNSGHAVTSLSFLQEIRRVQEHFSHIQNILKVAIMAFYQPQEDFCVCIGPI